MELSLLEAKTGSTNNNGPTTAGLAESVETRWIITDRMFSEDCISSLTALIGVDIRTVTGSRTEYPRIEIWRETALHYHRDQVSVELRLSPDNFTTNGLYCVTLPTPLNISQLTGTSRFYRLGVYQPPDDRSVVRFYKVTGTGQIGRVKNINDVGKMSVRGDIVLQTSSILIHPITLGSRCSYPPIDSSFNTNSLSVTNVIPVNDTRAFPDIQFTCNGITQSQDTSKHYPNIYLKRSSELIHALNVDASATTSSNGNVYLFTSDIEVEYGDILVINVTTNSNPMYYQQYNEPLNYQLDDSSDELIPLEHNDYPLISVVVVSVPASLTTDTMIPCTTSTSSTTSSYAFIHSTTAVTTESTKFFITSTSSITKDSLTIVSVLVYKRRHLKLTSRGNYQMDTHSTETELINMSNPTYQPQGMNPFPYEEPKPTICQTENETYNLLEEALTVPTANERMGGGKQQQDIYSTLMNEQYSSPYSRLDHTGGNGFFIEDTEYWEPDSNTDGIYQQLSDRKYREIIRHQIKVTDYLGSGQFGTVNKGLWTTPTAGSVSVAIKTLNDNTSEDERVKFLQEAAIMGQFHHPNVVKLHGVVTIGHPIMIVLELISGGDLKEYLNKFKPSPGELVLSSVPSILLSFCRQIASGMEYLSRKKFVHRDLAARNILVSDEGTGICKIADFGMSRDLKDESYYISQAKKIPIKWTAPEALHYKKYSSASDVWSYGAVMYEIWSLGHKPFEKSTNQESIRLVDSGYRLPPPPGCPKPMYKLMMQCWYSNDCSTEGFMEPSLLEAKTGSTNNNGPTTAGLAESVETRWIITDTKFSKSCLSSTEVLVGVDIRTETDNRTEYPGIEIWRESGGHYDRDPISVELRLSPHNFTTNGLYCVRLPTPLNIRGMTGTSNCYRLGVYQPPDDRSVVRFYKVTGTGQIGTLFRQVDINNDDVSQTPNQTCSQILIQPTTLGNSCSNPPISSLFNTNSLSVTNVIPVNDTRAVPDIQFTCNGIITNWIIGITQNQDTSKHYPNIYLKRSSELIHALTVDASAATSSNGNVYNFTSDIEVQYGDILVINVTTNSNPMYYQQYNGPLNYQLDDSSDELIPLEHNDYPLISVVVVSAPASLTTDTMIPCTTSTSSTTSSYALIYSTAAVTTESMESTSSITKDSFTIVSVLVYKKRHQKLTSRGNFPMDTRSTETELINMSNPIYQPQGINPFPYEEPKPTICQTENETYNLLGEALTIPTANERLGGGKQQQDIYSTLMNEQ
uniref:Protein kinase domain-containing protein n=1 Tax=Amphimedon queenslandica TaxID=400682 RepID=A0A1X7TJ27_AMPQE